MDLLTIGDVSMDLFMKIDEGADGIADGINDSRGGGTQELSQICFFHGSKINASQAKNFVGGNAANVAVGASMLGLKTAIYTETGNDDNAKKLIAELCAKGVDTSLCVQNKNSPTNIHTVLVYKNERTIITHHEKRNYTIQKWEEPKWIYYTSIGAGFENFQKDLLSYLKANVKIGVAFNPGTIQLTNGLAGVKNFLEVTDILFVNKDEAYKLVGNNSIDQTHIKLQSYGPKLTVITDGENGSTAYEGKNFYKQPCITPPATVVDKTGEGDAFASGFLSAIFYGRSIKEALVWASKNAAGKITKIGVGTGLLSKKDIEIRRA